MLQILTHTHTHTHTAHINIYRYGDMCIYIHLVDMKCSMVILECSKCTWHFERDSWAIMNFFFFCWLVWHFRSHNFVEVKIFISFYSHHRICMLMFNSKVKSFHSELIILLFYPKSGLNLYKFSWHHRTVQHMYMNLSAKTALSSKNKTDPTNDSFHKILQTSNYKLAEQKLLFFSIHISRISMGSSHNIILNWHLAAAVCFYVFLDVDSSYSSFKAWLTHFLVQNPRNGMDDDEEKERKKEWHVHEKRAHYQYFLSSIYTQGFGS